jgi:hypothetical protein
MNRVVVLLGCLLVGIGAGGRAYAQECRGSVTETEAQSAEDARYAAQMAGDFAALEKLLGKDLVYTHSSAAVDNKTSYIESQRSGVVRYKSMKRSDVTVRTYGCIAILTGKADFLVSNKGQESTTALRFHAIWAKRDAGLQFVSWQATRLPAQ